MLFKVCLVLNILPQQNSVVTTSVNLASSSGCTHTSILPQQNIVVTTSVDLASSWAHLYNSGTSKNFVDGVALRATTNPAAWRIACRRLASSIPRPASRHCLDRREISIAPFGFRHAAGREKRPSPHTKLHEKYDTDCWQTSVDWKQLFETTSFYGGQPPAGLRTPRSYAAKRKSCSGCFQSQNARVKMEMRLTLPDYMLFVVARSAAPSTKNFEEPKYRLSRAGACRTCQLCARC